MRLKTITLRVKNQDEAVKFYTEKLGFVKKTDITMGENRRWITISAPGDNVDITLQSPDWFEGENRKSIEKLIGNDPTMVFEVENCEKTYKELSAKGVKFEMPPKKMGYGTEADATDLYGNTIVFIQLE